MLLRHSLLAALALGLCYAAACSSDPDDGMCSDAKSEEPEGALTITIRNAGADPIFVESAFPADGVDDGYFDDRAYEVLQDGAPVRVSATCTELSCEAEPCASGCDPGPPMTYGPRKLAPGATLEYSWDGLGWATVTPAAGCRAEGCTETCMVRRAITGDVTVLARASATITCDAGACDCDLSGDSCQVPLENFDVGATLDAPVEVTQTIAFPDTTSVELVFE